MATNMQKDQPGPPVQVSSSQYQRRRLEKPAEIRPGQILWNPAVDGSGSSKDHTDHPCLVLSTDTAKETFVILTITSFRGLNIKEKFPNNFIGRMKHLPIGPSPPHPDTDLLLKLQGDAELDKRSYVKLENKYRAPWSELRRYEYGSQIYRLDEQSMAYIKKSLGLLVQVAKQGNNRKAYKVMQAQQKLLLANDVAVITIFQDKRLDIPSAATPLAIPRRRALPPPPLPPRKPLPMKTIIRTILLLVTLAATPAIKRWVTAWMEQTLTRDNLMAALGQILSTSAKLGIWTLGATWSVVSGLGNYALKGLMGVGALALGGLKGICSMMAARLMDRAH